MDRDAGNVYVNILHITCSVPVHINIKTLWFKQKQMPL